MINWKEIGEKYSWIPLAAIVIAAFVGLAIHSSKPAKEVEGVIGDFKPMAYQDPDYGWSYGSVTIKTTEEESTFRVQNVDIDSFLKGLKEEKDQVRLVITNGNWIKSAEKIK